MENEDVIREKMEGTRSSLTEKLETLEKQVVNTVQDATSSVTETVEAVKDTVNTVRETVQDTVQDTVNTVKGFFDIPGHVNRHPWAAVGGSVAVGFILGRIFAPPRVEIRRMEEASVRPSTGDLSLSSFASEGAQPAYRSPDYGHPNGKGQNGNGAHHGGLVSGLSSMLGMFQP